MQDTLASSEGMGSCAAFVNDTGAVDALCNSAGYGALVSSPAASLRLLPSSYASALQPQMSGTVITPPISVELIDVYGQRVSSDSTTFVALGPSTQLTGASSVRVTRGVAVFEQLMLRAPPNVSVPLQFSASRTLPSLAEDMATGRLQLTLRSARSTLSGLQLVNTSGNASFAHVSSCASVCTFTLPPPSGAHTTQLTLLFRIDLFRHEYDSLTIRVSRAMDPSTLSPYEQAFHWTGAQIVEDEQQQQEGNSQLTAIRSDLCPAGMPSCLYALTVPLDSQHVQVLLQTGDDAAAYVGGSWHFSSACPSGLFLHAPSDECFEERSSSSSVRGALLALVCVALILVVLVAVAVWVWREQPPVRAAQPAFLLFMLLCLLLLPISALLFLQVPDVVGSSGMCVARLCCLSVVVGGCPGRPPDEGPSYRPVA
jgi:hypothetical protein